MTPTAQTPLGPIDATSLTALGFTAVGSYGALVVYEGPRTASASATAALVSTGLQAWVADDLQGVHLIGHDIDVDTGIATPPLPTAIASPALASTTSGLFVLALRSYPQPDWLADLTSRGIEIVEPLPPNAYIVRATTTQINAASPSDYAANAWHLTPSMKTVAVDAAPFIDAEPYHEYEIEAFEDDITPSLQPLLNAADHDAAAFVMARIGHRVHYAAQLTSDDVASLALLEQVFAISPIGPMVLAGERQANLVAQPSFSGANLVLPATASSYTGFLNGKCYPSSPNCISNFSNTHVGIVDTGFDVDRTGFGATKQGPNAGGTISSTATSVVVYSAAGFPTSGSYTILEGTEQMLVTAGQGSTTWTITRGYHGTTPASHADNAPIMTATTQGNNGGSISATATTIIVSSAAGLPTSGNYSILLGTEEMLVTAGQGTTTWTVMRGFNRTTATTHADGSLILLAPHLDFNPGQVLTQYGATTFSQVRSNQNHETLMTEDDFTHGSVTAALIGGSTAATTGRQDCGSYRYALGLAPGALMATDKFAWFGSGFLEIFCEGSVHQGVVSACVLKDALDKFNTSGWLADVVNHSWNESGTGSCAYTGTSQQLDLATRTGLSQQSIPGSTIHPQLDVVAAGNTPDEASCTTVRAPATARNVLAVGATYGIAPTCTTWSNLAGGGGGTFALTCPWDFVPSTQDGRAMPTFSAPGTSSGQLKPDLVAPGVITTGPVSRDFLSTPCATIPPTGTRPTIFCNTPLDSSTYCSTPYVQYGLSAGTSWAAPIVTGAAAVVRKWYRLINGVDPSPAMTKAILIGGARDIAGGTLWAPNSPTNPTGLVSAGTIGHIPSRQQGWGMVSFDKLLGQASSYFFWDQSAARTYTGNQVMGSTLAIVDGTKETRLTLVWTDAYKPTSSPTGTVFASLVNNLDLEAFVGIGDPYYYGNNFDANGHSIPDPVTVVFDNVNTVEEILIPANTYTTGTGITFYVEGNGIMGDAITPDNSNTPRQDFAVFAYNLH
jgi:hypothetical protein